MCGGVFTMLRGQNQAVSTQGSGATKSTVPFLRSAQQGNYIPDTGSLDKELHGGGRSGYVHF